MRRQPAPAERLQYASFRNTQPEGFGFAMLSRLAQITATGGGLWGMAWSLNTLIQRDFDALFFLLLTATLHGLAAAAAWWPRIALLGRALFWLGVGGVLSYLAYLSGYSIGVFLLPSAGLILFAGVLAGGSLISAKPDAAPPAPETGQPEGLAGDPRLSTLSTLTPREVDVLALIAEGKSNREIAEALVVSPNTVRHHVHQILSKLNCASRGEAAALARAADFRPGNPHQR